MTTLCKRRLNFGSRSCSFRKHHWPLSDGCLGDGDNLQSIDLSATMVIRRAANIWLYGSFTRMKKQQSSRIWQVTIFHLFSFSCPQEGVSFIQEHKKSNFCLKESQNNYSLLIFYPELKLFSIFSLIKPPMVAVKLCFLTTSHKSRKFHPAVAMGVSRNWLWHRGGWQGQGCCSLSLHHSFTPI